MNLTRNEYNVIGCACLIPDHYRRAVNELSPDHFQGDDTREVFRMLLLYSALIPGEDVDPLALCEFCLMNSYHFSEEEINAIVQLSLNTANPQSFERDLCGLLSQEPTP